MDKVLDTFRRKRKKKLCSNIERKKEHSLLNFKKGLQIKLFNYEK